MTSRRVNRFITFILISCKLGEGRYGTREGQIGHFIAKQRALTHVPDLLRWNNSQRRNCKQHTEETQKSGKLKGRGKEEPMRNEDADR